MKPVCFINASRIKLVLKGEPCNGGNQSKERLTVLVACNMSGIDKCDSL